MKVIYFLSFFLIIHSARVYGQTLDYQYFITINGNLYLPSSSANKGVYPILWYDKGTDPKLLIGGFGFGLSVIKSLERKIGLKGQANISKHTYWDEPILLNTILAEPRGQFLAGSSDYTLGLAACVHYYLSKKISVGTGLGAHVLLVSLSRVPDIDNTPNGIAVNRYYKPVMPVLPLELSMKLEKVLFNIRYEQGLLNRLNGALAKHKNDRYGLLSFEIGFKIK